MSRFWILDFGFTIISSKICNLKSKIGSIQNRVSSSKPDFQSFISYFTQHFVINRIEMTTGIIFDIKRYAIHDGPGIRTTVFLKGCAASCWWCHNPESQTTEIEQAVRKNRLDDCVIEEIEMIGKKMTVREVLIEIKKDRVYFDESGGGVTFSGGEPLLQENFLRELLIACRQDGIHTTLDTTGYASEDVFNSIIDHVDLFLYDIKFIDDNLHQKFTGVSNMTILNNLITLVKMNKSVRLRLPVIPEMTDSIKNINEIV